MSTRQAIESHRDSAEVYYGAALCKQKSSELLAELHLPKGLLPLAEMEEVGYNRVTGFVWLRQKKASSHVFKVTGRAVFYAGEVMAFVADRRMRRVSGVKRKELLVWLTVAEMLIDCDDPKTITFKTPAGLSRSFPVSAFEEVVAAA